MELAFGDVASAKARRRPGYTHRYKVNIITSLLGSCGRVKCKMANYCSVAFPIKLLIKWIKDHGVSDAQPKRAVVKVQTTSSNWHRKRSSTSPLSRSSLNSLPCCCEAAHKYSPSQATPGKPAMLPHHNRLVEVVGFGIDASQRAAVV